MATGDSSHPLVLARKIHTPPQLPSGAKRKREVVSVSLLFQTLLFDLALHPLAVEGVTVPDACLPACLPRPEKKTKPAPELLLGSQCNPLRCPPAT